MRRIAIINQKGGVGKTTTTANLGAALARRGQRVLVADLDPQAHLTLHYGIEVSDDQSSVYDVLTSSTPVADALIDVNDGVSLLPADIDLAAAESELVSVAGREVILREALEAVDGDIDTLLIDCPPSLGVLTLNALSAVEEVIIPLQAHFFGLQGLGKLFDTVMLVRQRINPTLVVSGVVLCMHEATTRLASEVVDDLKQFLGSARGTKAPWSDAILFKTRIRRNIRLAEASSFGQTVFDYAPQSNGAADYERLAREVVVLNEGETAQEADTIDAIEKTADSSASVAEPPAPSPPREAPKKPRKSATPAKRAPAAGQPANGNKRIAKPKAAPPEGARAASQSPKSQLQESSAKVASKAKRGATIASQAAVPKEAVESTADASTGSN